MGNPEIGKRDLALCARRDVRCAIRSVHNCEITVGASISRSLLLYTCMWIQSTAMSVLYWLVGTAVLMQLLACHCSASHECIHDKVYASDCHVRTGL